MLNEFLIFIVKRNDWFEVKVDFENACEIQFINYKSVPRYTIQNLNAPGF